MRARGEPRVKVVAVAAVLIALLVIPTISSSINIYAIRIDNNSNSNNSIADVDTYNKEVIANKLLNTRISLPFIANVGQYDDSNIKYYADTFVGRVLIYDDDNNNGIVYLLKDNVIKERLIITSTADNNTTSTDSIILKGNDPSITKVNYFKANKVLTDIPTYNSISFVSNSIELILKAYNNNIEKVFVVKPYADVNDIVMEVDNNNSSSISIDNDGRLIIINDDDNNNNNDGIAFTKPIAYQIIDGKKVNVDVSYRIIADNRYGFSVGNYDNRYDLIIDPLLDLSASTYIGGVDYDAALAIAIDNNNNNVFIAGYTLSNDFPIEGGYDNSYNGFTDAFVAKFNNDLNQLLASTYIGGGVNNDYALAIAIDNNNNNVFIAGYTLSNDFPIKDGYDNTFNGFADAFVAKFNNDLNQLLASTYIGGEDYNFAYDIAWAIAIDSNNNVFIAGGTSSNNFPIVNGYDNSYNGFTDAFVAKFNNDLNQLLASTYIGGGRFDDLALAIAIDNNNNNVFIAGETSSDDFPIVNGYDNSYNGLGDAFVAKFNNDLNQLLASTYIGGRFDDFARAIVIDNNNNNVFIAGGTWSYDFPIVNGYDDSYNGLTDAFVAKFNNDLNQLLASTYIGGGGYDFARTIAIDSNNNVFIAGYTLSNDFPIKDGYDNSYNGYVDAFVAKLTSIELTYNLNLYEGSNPSDGVINLGDSITAKATTNDSSIINVKFIWIDPSNNEARNTTVNIVDGEASDTYTPNQVGTWKVVAEFSNGIIVVKELQVPFQVVPESIIGALSVIGSSLAVLAVYRRRRKANNN
jgi:hypothetical protein